MFYLTTHSTHFIYGYMASDIWLRTILIVRKETCLPPHRLLLSIDSKGSFICTIPDRITHTTAFVTPVVEHWLEREIAQWVYFKQCTNKCLLMIILMFELREEKKDLNRD